MNKFSQTIGGAFVLHTNDVKIEGNISYLPLYMAGLL